MGSIQSKSIETRPSGRKGSPTWPRKSLTVASLM
jgi:hypothetical protein